jgi:ABC-type enterochelin transport system ATPase subunit
MPHSKKKRNETENLEYVEANKTKTEEKILEKFQSSSREQISAKMEFCDEDDSNIYNNPIYNFFTHKYNQELPIFQIKDQIIEELAKTNIIIIQGSNSIHCFQGYLLKLKFIYFDMV